MSSFPVLEHGSTRPTRWFRAQRFRIALIVGLVEAGLVVLNVVQARWVLLAALAVFAFYFFVGRRTAYAWLRQISWVAALAQAVALLIPLVALFVATIAVVIVIAFAVVILFLLFLDRR